MKRYQGERGLERNNKQVRGICQVNQGQNVNDRSQDEEATAPFFQYKTKHYGNAMHRYIISQCDDVDQEEEYEDGNKYDEDTEQDMENDQTEEEGDDEDEGDDEGKDNDNVS